MTLVHQKFDNTQQSLEDMDTNVKFLRENPSKIMGLMFCVAVEEDVKPEDWAGNVRAFMIGDSIPLLHFLHDHLDLQLSEYHVTKTVKD